MVYCLLSALLLASLQLVARRDGQMLLIIQSPTEVSQALVDWKGMAIGAGVKCHDGHVMIYVSRKSEGVYSFLAGPKDGPQVWIDADINRDHTAKISGTELLNGTPYYMEVRLGHERVMWPEKPKSLSCNPFTPPLTKGAPSQ